MKPHGNERIVALSLLFWTGLTLLVLLSTLGIYLWKGPVMLSLLIQEGALSDLALTLWSIALVWLIAGGLLLALHQHAINSKNIIVWAGFLLTSLLYINILRERTKYGDLQYYINAAIALTKGQPLPTQYVYPPLWAIFLKQFVPLGSDFIFVLNWVLNLCALGLFYFLLVSILQRYKFLPNLAGLVAALFLVVNVPALRTLVYGQVNFYVMDFILLNLILYRRFPFLSAFTLAIAIHLKASPIILAIGFLFEKDWKWLVWLGLSLAAIGLITLATDGITPYLNYLHNAGLVTALDNLKFRDNSFDSFFTALFSFLRLGRVWVTTFTYASKLILAVVVILIVVKTVQGKTFIDEDQRGAKLFNAVPPLFILMTLTSPLMWEHHGVFVTLSFLLLLKRLETPGEWMLFGCAYLLEFLMPTFDFFPWSYGRLAAPLIVLWLIWRIVEHQKDTELFASINQWLQQLPSMGKTA